MSVSRLRASVVAIVLVLGAVAPARAQTFAVPDPVLERIWRLGMDSSHAMTFLQVLADSIGPRLTGSPGIKAGNDWLVKTYGELGVTARNEKYGTWKAWRRGVTHVDLIAPRVRTLEATMLAWSPGTKGAVEGAVMVLPDLPDSAAYARWLGGVKGAFVAISFPQPTCRPDSSYKQFALAETFDRMVKERTEAQTAWDARVTRTGFTVRELPKRLEQAGAKGVLTSLWSRGWGVDKIFNARTETVPTVDLSCEDYGLVARLAQNNQGPKLRVEAESQALGEQPVFNTIAEIKGTKKPEEYVVLSAHFDSWDGSSGATDNGTGTVTMLEAMRILKQVLPNPTRTIIVGHWSGEEQGLNGSRAFAADHPEIVKGLQALFNQDNGTGRVVSLNFSGLPDAGRLFGTWLSRVPNEFTRNFTTIGFPGTPAGGGSDNASFICYGAPAFGLGALNWEYGTYTWHTNRDTYDKAVPDDLKGNATMTAMLAYLASEDASSIDRTKRVMPKDPRSGQQQTWPACVTPARSSGESTR